MKVKLNNLSKGFFSLRGEVAALKEINVEINDREFFVLLGPSGCGKSTLLNLIAGLEKPSRGEILFDDKPVASRQKRIFLTPRERNIAFVFQSYALYPHLNVFENIAFPLRVVGTEKKVIEEKVKTTAAVLEIANLLPAKPAELSGGQRQRVAIARAIVRQPNLFLLDEPLSNLDAQLRVLMRAELKNLQRRLGITAIYVTHDQTEALCLGDRIAVLREGKIEQLGTPRQLYENPANAFVGSFIGTPPMNLIKAAFVKENEDLFIIIGNTKIVVPAEKRDAFRNLKTNHFLLGIRPEHIGLRMEAAAGPLKARVNSVEHLGKDMLVHALLDAEKITLIGQEQPVKEGDNIGLEFDICKVHIFKIP